MGGHWLKAGFSLTAYDPIPAATEELARKDMTIALEMSDHARLPLPLCGLVREQVKALRRKAGY